MISPAWKLGQAMGLGEVRQHCTGTWGVMTSLLRSQRPCVCLQPAGVPVLRRLRGRPVLQRPRLPALSPLLCLLCWYLVPCPVVYSSGSGLAPVALASAVAPAAPPDSVKANAGETRFSSRTPARILRTPAAGSPSLALPGRMPGRPPPPPRAFDGFGKWVQFKRGVSAVLFSPHRM